MLRLVRLVVLPAKVPKEVRDALGYQASALGKTRSRLVREILESHLNGRGYTQIPDIQIERSERRKP